MSSIYFYSTNRIKSSVNHSSIAFKGNPPAKTTLVFYPVMHLISLNHFN
jgi:hypothetical protein